LETKVLTDESAPSARQLFLDLKRILQLLHQCLRFGVFPYAHLLPFRYQGLSYPVRVRRVFEEMGLTYLKLGQFLALRFDILPREVCQELNRLFEKVTPMSAANARRVVEGELGGPVENYYREFETEPLAAGSVAQVHKARTMAGERVVVKIQRAGIEPIFRADIRNLRRITSLVDTLHLLGRLTARGMLEEFAKWTLREMDFVVEGGTAERLRRDALSFEVIPQIYWNLTTSKVLTMELIDGVSASRLHELQTQGQTAEIARAVPGFDMPLALHRLTVISCRQLFLTGFFHGDPHPGNVLFLPHNAVAFIDFGIFGSVSEEEREILVGQIEHLALGDIETSLRYYSRQLTPTEETDLDAFRKDALEVLHRWYSRASDPTLPIEERHLARYTGEMIDVSRRNKMRYGLNYLLFWRALNNLNGTLWMVDPQFDMMLELRRFFEEVRPDAVERATAVVTDAGTQGDWYDFITRLPERAEGALAGRAGGERAAQVSVTESGRKQRAGLDEVRLIVAGTLAASLAVFAGATQVNWAVRAAVCVAASVFMLVSRVRFK
jgi:ubiquinone biosynthesis protein